MWRCKPVGMLALLHDIMIACLHAYKFSRQLAMAMPRRPLLAASGDIMRGVLCGALCIVGAVARVPRMLADFEQLFGGIIDAKAPCRGGHTPDKINPGEVGAVVDLVRFGAVKAVLIIRPLAQIAAFEAGRGQRRECLLRCDKAKLL